MAAKDRERDPGQGRQREHYDAEQDDHPSSDEVGQDEPEDRRLWTASKHAAAPRIRMSSHLIGLL